VCVMVSMLRHNWPFGLCADQHNKWIERWGALGVENAQQYQRLADMGCTAFQGNYFGSAQPAQDLIKTGLAIQALALTGKA